MIESISKITKDQIIQQFNHLFFENPRRVNIKYYSKNHLDQKDKI